MSSPANVTLTPQLETPNDLHYFALLLTALLYSAAIATAVLTLRPSLRPSSLDLTLKSFGFEPISIRDYGRRFNRALDDGALVVANLTLAERIAINQRMGQASYHYIDLDRAIRQSVTLDQVMAVAATGERPFPTVKHRGRGNYSLLLVGNSHAAQVEKELRSGWRQHYDTFEGFMMTCLPLELNYLGGWRRLVYGTRSCDIYPAAVLKLVEKMKPDMLFINFRWDNDIYQPPLTSPIEEDRVFRSLQSAISRMEANVGRRIFIGAPNLQFPYTTPHNELAKRLWLNASLDSLNLDFKTHQMRTRSNWTRLRHLRCDKCVLVDWSQVFCSHQSGSTSENVADKRVCHSFDPDSQLAYFIDEHHYSYLGCRKIRALLRRIAEMI